MDNTESQTLSKRTEETNRPKHTKMLGRPILKGHLKRSLSVENPKTLKLAMLRAKKEVMTPEIQLRSLAPRLPQAHAMELNWQG